MTYVAQRSELADPSSLGDQVLHPHGGIVGPANTSVNVETRNPAVEMFADRAPCPESPGMFPDMANHAANFGRLITVLRKQRRLTQVELAAEIGVARSTIAGIERGNYMPGRETLAALADFFHITIDEMRHGMPGPGSPTTRQVIDDPNELAWVRLYRNLTDEQRALMFRLLTVPERNDSAA